MTTANEPTTLHSSLCKKDFIFEADDRLLLGHFLTKVKTVLLPMLADQHCWLLTVKFKKVSFTKPYTKPFTSTSNTPCFTPYCTLTPFLCRLSSLRNLIVQKTFCQIIQHRWIFLKFNSSPGLACSKEASFQAETLAMLKWDFCTQSWNSLMCNTIADKGIQLGGASLSSWHRLSCDVLDCNSISSS